MPIGVSVYINVPGLLKLVSLNLNFIADYAFLYRAFVQTVVTMHTLKNKIELSFIKELVPVVAAHLPIKIQPSIPMASNPAPILFKLPTLLGVPKLCTAKHAMHKRLHSMRSPSVTPIDIGVKEDEVRYNSEVA